MAGTNYHGVLDALPADVGGFLETPLATQGLNVLTAHLDSFKQSLLHLSGFLLKSLGALAHTGFDRQSLNEQNDPRWLSVSALHTHLETPLRQLHTDLDTVLVGVADVARGLSTLDIALAIEGMCYTETHPKWLTSLGLYERSPYSTLAELRERIHGYTPRPSGRETLLVPNALLSLVEIVNSIASLAQQPFPEADPTDDTFVLVCADCLSSILERLSVIGVLINLELVAHQQLRLKR